jgi:rod shape-determining protein MreB
VAVRPLRQGVISDYTVTEKMIKYFIQKALGKKSFRKPRISVCIPSGATEVEKKAVEDATYNAGAREVAIIEEPIAAAIGAGIDISRPCGNMIVDIGGGTADIAVISLGGAVVSTSIKIAGDDFDEALVRYMRKKHNLLIGERTAEDIKIKIGTCYPMASNETMDVRGRNLVTGLPRTITVSSEETEEALREPTLQIVEAVHSVLEKTPPELAADVADRGIVLTGGGALLRGLEELIEDRTGINTMTAEQPMTCVAIGTGKFVEFLAGKRDDD